MPRVKSSPIKNSKKLVSAKRFRLTKLQIAFVALIVSAVGAVVIYKSHASSNAWASAASYYGCPLTGYGVPAGSLQLGSSGNCVKLLQVGLNMILATPITIDGNFGNSTYNEVITLQKLAAGPVNGVVNSSLWAFIASNYNIDTGGYPTSATYYYNSPGIAHSVGQCPVPGLLLVNGSYITGSTCLWVTGSATDHFLQYGPYQTMAILPGQHGLNVCYDFYNFAGSNSAATGTFSVYNDLAAHPNGTTVIVGALSQSFPNVVTPYNVSHPGAILIQPHCTTYPLAAGLYQRLEFRFRVNGSSPAGTLQLYRTRVSVY